MTIESIRSRGLITTPQTPEPLAPPATKNPWGNVRNDSFERGAVAKPLLGEDKGPWWRLKQLGSLPAAIAGSSRSAEEPPTEPPPEYIVDALLRTQRQIDTLSEQRAQMQRHLRELQTHLQNGHPVSTTDAPFILPLVGGMADAHPELALATHPVGRVHGGDVGYEALGERMRAGLRGEQPAEFVSVLDLAGAGHRVAASVQIDPLTQQVSIVVLDGLRAGDEDMRTELVTPLQRGVAELQREFPNIGIAACAVFFGKQQGVGCTIHSISDAKAMVAYPEVRRYLKALHRGIRVALRQQRERSGEQDGERLFYQPILNTKPIPGVLFKHAQSLKKLLKHLTPWQLGDLVNKQQTLSQRLQQHARQIGEEVYSDSLDRERIRYYQDAVATLQSQLAGLGQQYATLTTSANERDLRAVSIQQGIDRFRALHRFYDRQRLAWHRGASSKEPDSAFLPELVVAMNARRPTQPLELHAIDADADSPGFARSFVGRLREVAEAAPTAPAAQGWAGVLNVECENGQRHAVAVSVRRQAPVTDSPPSLSVVLVDSGAPSDSIGFPNWQADHVRSLLERAIEHATRLPQSTTHGSTTHRPYQRGSLRAQPPRAPRLDIRATLYCLDTEGPTGQHSAAHALGAARLLRNDRLAAGVAALHQANASRHRGASLHVADDNGTLPGAFFRLSSTRQRLEALTEVQRGEPADGLGSTVEQWAAKFQTEQHFDRLGQVASVRSDSAQVKLLIWLHDALEHLRVELNGAIKVFGQDAPSNEPIRFERLEKLYWPREPQRRSQQLEV